MGWLIDVPVIGWSGFNKGGLEIRENKGNVEPSGLVTDYSSFFTIKHQGGDGKCYTNIKGKGFRLDFYFTNFKHDSLGYQLFVKNSD